MKTCTVTLTVREWRAIAMLTINYGRHFLPHMKDGTAKPPVVETLRAVDSLHAQLIDEQLAELIKEWQGIKQGN